MSLANSFRTENSSSPTGILLPFAAETIEANGAAEAAMARRERREREWLDILSAQYHKSPLSMTLLFPAALLFAIGGLFMKLSDGGTRLWPTLAFCVLFLAGAFL